MSGDYTYTGTAHQPSGGNVAVTLNGSTLMENTDYTLSYSDHTNAGTATVTGTGDYSGTVTGTFTIAPAALTIDGVTLQSKTYDGTTAATVDSVAFTGFVKGETLDGGSGYTVTAAFDGPDAGTGKTAAATVTLQNANYTFADGPAAEYELTGLTIDRRPVAVTPNAVSKKYGQIDPELTYAAPGLVSGESLAGELSRAPGEDVGSYAITQNTLTDDNNPNYAITSTENQALTIDPANVTLTVTVDPASQKAGKTVTAPLSVTAGLAFAFAAL